MGPFSTYIHDITERSAAPIVALFSSSSSSSFPRRNSIRDVRILKSIGVVWAPLVYIYIYNVFPWPFFSSSAAQLPRINPRGGAAGSRRYSRKRAIF